MLGLSLDLLELDAVRRDPRSANGLLCLPSPPSLILLLGLLSALRLWLWLDLLGLAALLGLADLLGLIDRAREPFERRESSEPVRSRLATRIGFATGGLLEPSVFSLLRGLVALFRLSPARAPLLGLTLLILPGLLVRLLLTTVVAGASWCSLVLDLWLNSELVWGSGSVLARRKAASNLAKS